MDNATDLNSAELSAFDVDGFYFYKKTVSSAALQAGGAIASLNKELAKGTVLDIRTLLSHLKAAGAAQGKSQAWDSLVKQAKRVCRARGWRLSTTKDFPVEPITKASDSDKSESGTETETETETASQAPTFNQILSLVLSLTEDEQGQILGEIAKSLDLDVSKIKEKSGSIKRPTLVAAIKASAKDQGPASLDQVA